MRAIAISAGLLAAARRVTSPNADPRPRGFEPELIVIHGISLPPGRYGGPWVDRLFTNSLPAEADPYFATIRELRVSSHVLIDRKGRITQYVPFHERAWHAGQSYWRGRANCNDFSIGIELEGCDTRPFTDMQYQTLHELTLALRAAYPLRGIAGHSDIAPGRKTDPGPHFDWLRYLCGVCEA